MSMLEGLQSYTRQRPRTVAALVFGSLTMVVIHLAWAPGARLNGFMPALTIAAGIAQALAAAITGPRLVDRTRTDTSLQAAMIGAGTLLLAIALFSPVFVLFLYATGVHSPGILSYLVLTVLTGMFSFLAGGWTLLLISVAIAWGLNRIATLRLRA